MRVAEAYNNWSSTYDSDRNFTRDLDEQITRETLGNFDVISALELGCGTGKNSKFLSQIAGRLVSLDFSTGMLSQAKNKMSSVHAHFVAADLTKPWPLADEKFELAVCNLVLEHIEDLGPVFAEANRTLVAGAHFFISELHPFRQYRGTVANFQRGEVQIEIPAFVHHISDFLHAASANNFTLQKLNESWHEGDVDKPPRLVSFMFKKIVASLRVTQKHTS